MSEEQRKGEMNRTRRFERSKYIGGKCAARRKCAGPAVYWYITPSLTRSRNLSTRTYACCEECAKRIGRKYPGILVWG
jgi:hypothetical protein